MGVREPAFDLERAAHRDGPLGILGRPVLQHLTVDLVRSTGEAIAAAKTPWPERLHAIARLGERQSPVLSWIARPFAQGWFVVFRPVRGAQGQAPAIASALASVRCARLAIAVEQYRRARGALPERLRDLTLEADEYVDPFSGKSLGYVRDEGGYTVYSIGRNFRDDGGRLTGEPTKGQAPAYVQPLDIGLRVQMRLPSSP